MPRTVLLNLKRLAGNKALLLLCMLAPALLFLAFGSVIAPVFFSGGMENFEVAVLNEDTSPLTDSIVRGLVENEKTKGIVSVRFVASREDGLRMLESGAPAFITIPPGFQDTLRGGKQGVIGLRLNPSKPLESALVRDVLESGAQMVNDAQKGVNSLYNALVVLGMPGEQASAVYNSSAREFMLQALNRSAAVGVQGELSPLGSLLPVEYYASALLAVFLFFGAMGVAGLAAQDTANGILDRDLCMGRGGGFASFISSRVLAGAALVFLQGIPAVGLILLFSASAGFFYSGSAALAFPALLLFAFAVSSGGVWAGVLMRSRDSAVKGVFLMICALALIGGALIPASGLGFLSSIAPFTPINASMRLFSNTLFFFDARDFAQSVSVVLAYALLFSSGAYFTAARRA